MMLLGAVLALGCPGNGGESDSATETGTGTTDGMTTTTGMTTGTTGPTTGEPTTSDATTTTSDATTTTGTPTTSEDTTTMGQTGAMCDPTLQDCADGYKCIAYDSPEGPDPYWDANQCVPIPPNPGAKGDSCDINMGESVFSGLDNCDEGLICFNFDFSNGQDGICTAFCGPGESCGAGEICLPNANEGVLPLCLPTCDPLLQDCPFGHACYGDPSLPEFFCARPDPGDETGTDDSPCQFTNACLAGFACVSGDVLEGC
ncbi:MAG TPA: hypothetical protein VIK91_12360 [Nannocystis sp.]